jgi:hypothetical protein
VAVDVLTEITIGRPIDVVATYVADPSNAPVWYDNIESVEWETEPVLRVGAKVAFVAHFLGKRLARRSGVVVGVATAAVFPVPAH